MSGEKPRRADDLTDAYRSRITELRAVAARAGPGEGADIVQEAFLRVVEAEERTVVRSPVRMLFRVVQNLATDRLRARARSRLLFDPSTGEDGRDDGADPERALIASERLRLSLSIIDRMTPKRRTIFLLHRLEGLSYPQIARRTGVSVKTVEKQMTAAMAFLSREMSAHVEKSARPTPGSSSLKRHNSRNGRVTER